MSDDQIWWQKPDKGPAGHEVAFDYIKSQDFRVVWADGAIGGVTPQGLVHFALYSERGAIPRRQVFTIKDETLGKLGEEVIEKRITRDSIVREMACDVFLTPSAAENLANWILKTLDDAKSGKKKESDNDGDNS